MLRASGIADYVIQNLDTDLGLYEINSINLEEVVISPVSTGEITFSFADGYKEATDVVFGTLPCGTIVLCLHNHPLPDFDDLLPATVVLEVADVLDGEFYVDVDKIVISKDDPPCDGSCDVCRKEYHG